VLFRSGCSSADVIRALMPVRQSAKEGIRLDSIALDRPDSGFEIQAAKLKVHHLSGTAGRQFLKSVGDDFLSIVSESRAFLDGSVFGDDAASHLARAKGKDGSALRVLRDADRVELERFGLTTSLRSLARISSLVDPAEARQAARKTQKRIREVVDGEAHWFSEIDVLFDLFRLAFSTSDSESIAELFDLSARLWGEDGLQHHFSRLTRRGKTAVGARAWKRLKQYLDSRTQEAIAGSLRSEHLDANGFLSRGLTAGAHSISFRATANLALTLASADLRWRDREDDDLKTKYSTEAFEEWRRLPFSITLRRRFKLIDRYVARCRGLGDEAWAVPSHRMFVLTRPPSYFDIARRLLYWVEHRGFRTDVFQMLLKVVNAVRGTEYSDAVGRVIGPATV